MARGSKTRARAGLHGGSNEAMPTPSRRHSGLKDRPVKAQRATAALPERKPPRLRAGSLRPALRALALGLLQGGATNPAPPRALPHLRRRRQPAQPVQPAPSPASPQQSVQGPQPFVVAYFEAYHLPDRRPPHTGRAIQINSEAPAVAAGEGSKNILTGSFDLGPVNCTMRVALSGHQRQEEPGSSKNAPLGGDGQAGEHGGRGKEGGGNEGGGKEGGGGGGQTEAQQSTELGLGLEPVQPDLLLPSSHHQHDHHQPAPLGVNDTN